MNQESQVTDTVFMVRPIRFYSNPQTLSSNAFQATELFSGPEIQSRALEQFDSMVDLLRSSGIRVILAQDYPEPDTPDSIFPNNWISFHSNGTAFLYPMCAANRRTERSKGLEKAIREAGYQWTNVDLTSWENTGRYLEGTGSMVLDRQNKVAYACRSPRTDDGLFRTFCQELGYKPVLFGAWHVSDGKHHEIYHTNVMLCIGEHLAIICAESISLPEERTLVLNVLSDSGKEIILISPDQMNHYAGNMLELRSVTGEHLMVMSAQALRSLYPEQVSKIEKHCRIIAPEIETIETHGGGSARCMLAEVFLPPPL